MQLSRTLGGVCNLVNGKEFPTNSVIMNLDNKITLVCTSFKYHKKPLQVYCYIHAEKKWLITYLKGQCKDAMWEYHHKCNRKRKSENYSQMMRHDRRHKSGGGGSRIYNGSITDYECTKNPLHDFRRVYN